jgi:Holliday junction resolvasome RuvABC endonuclease subunit
MIIGFDYSLSCPAMCLAFQPDLANCSVYYLTSTQKYVGTRAVGFAIGEAHIDYKTPEHRYDAISQHFITTLDRLKIPASANVIIEDYAFAAAGRVFHIAENTGLMKWKLWKRGHHITVVPPTVIKKHATGKGNAKKEQMYASFVLKTGLPLATVLGANPGKIGSPVGDIVDAYWIAQYGYTLRTA